MFDPRKILEDSVKQWIQEGYTNEEIADAVKGAQVLDKDTEIEIVVHLRHIPKSIVINIPTMGGTNGSS